MKDQFTLKIYKEICIYYVNQLRLNIEEPFLAEKPKHNERYLHKFNYLFLKDTVTLEIDGFTCTFNDAFMIKAGFDKILDKEDRFFYFSQPLPIKPEVSETIKPKRSYTKKIKPIAIKLPQLTIWQTIKLILKAA